MRMRVNLRTYVVFEYGDGFEDGVVGGVDFEVILGIFSLEFIHVNMAFGWLNIRLKK